MKKSNRFRAVAAAVLCAIGMMAGAQNSENSEHATINSTLVPWLTTGNTIGSVLGRDYGLGTLDANPLPIFTDGTARLYIATNGNIGINTTNPKQMLHVVNGNIMISRFSQRAPGSTNGSLMFSDTVSTNCQYGKWAIEYLNSDADGHGLNFWKPHCHNEAVHNNLLFLADNGNVGIGTNEPAARLTVDGNICAKEVRVALTGTPCWPDYVFDSEYQLMGIVQLENYINSHHHLPDIPSANEVEQDGVDLGEMNTLLLGKIEQLTLYIIDLQKQINELKSK